MLLFVAAAELGSELFGQVGRPSGLNIEALASRDAHSDSDTLFRRLVSSEIGLGEFENNYSGPDVWTRRWREYILGTIGTGIAMGDIDGDRLPDFFVASKDEKSRLYRNLGGLKFEDISDVSGFVDSSDPASGCAMVDIDGDGDLDIYALHVGGPNQLWINDGTGRFEEKGALWGVDISSGCTMASFADFDRDGDLDFYLQNNLISVDDDFQKLADQLFENKGARFEEVTDSAGISGQGHGHAAVWWDFNQDGWPDIYVANDFEDLDKLYLNNGDGTFVDVLSEVAPHVPYYSMGADFGDINNDGQVDFWVADMAAMQREHHLRTVGNHNHVYEIDPDGEAHQYLKNALLLGLNSDRFAEIGFLSGLAASDWTWAARLVDMDNDGLLDAFATNGMLRSFHDGDLGAKQGAFASHDWMTIVFRNEPVMRERNLAFVNKGDLVFEDRSSEWGVDRPSVSFGVAFGDLDLDGDLDFISNDYLDGLSVYENTDTKNNRIAIALRGGESNAYGLGAKVRLTSGGITQSRELVSMRGYMSTDEPILHFGLGQNERIERIEVDWPSGRRQVFEDLPVNRRVTIRESAEGERPSSSKTTGTRFVRRDISWPNAASRSEAYFSDFGKQSQLPFPLSRRGGGLALGDLNGDGKLDLALGGAAGQETSILLNEGGGSFSQSLSLDLEEDFGSEDQEVHLIDWDGDGDLDLLVASGGVEMPPGDAFLEDRLYLNQGDGSFLRDWDQAFSNIAQATTRLIPADVDGDGDVDLFQGGGSLANRYPHAVASRLWIREEGLFEETDVLQDDNEMPGNAISSGAWGDVDDDGDLDLILAREWNAPLLLENVEGRLKASALGFESLSGLWSCVAIEDLDGDGLVDIVLGNWGLNSEFRASVEEPMRLWHSKAGDRENRLIETFISGGKEWAREARWRLEKAFPRELRRVRSYEQFATTEFPALFPDIESQGFESLSVEELRSGILWQTESGVFQFDPLPSFAQMGRVESILIKDANGDGHLDLILALDHPSPEPWSGRFEPGYLGLFLNRGERCFETDWAGESGLVVRGAPRNLAWGDLDGDGRPELVVRYSEGAPDVFSLSDGSRE